MFIKRTISSVLCLSVLLTTVACGKTAESAGYPLVPLSASVSKEISVPYTPSQYEKAVNPYKVNSDLSNVANLKQFGSFSDGEKKLLSQNAFVVSPTAEEQLFYLYEKNSYLKIPNFITADSVLQLYHIFYDYSLRNLESTSLIQAVDELTDSMLKKSIQIYGGVKNSDVKNAALKNIAYFGTAALGLKKVLPADMPAEAKTLAEKEYALIQAKSGFASSPSSRSNWITASLNRGGITREATISRGILLP